LLERLAKANVAFTEANDQPGVRRGHVHDPFGNRIELVQSELASGRPSTEPGLGPA
jgi:catechol 2,3-dioxygenase-like lactoylglutathione lyase family enzyme